MEDKEYNEKLENRSIKYSNFGIITVIVLLAIISIITSHFVEKSDFLKNNFVEYDYMTQIFQNSINDSLYDDSEDNIIYPYDGINKSIKYIIRGFKVDNFEKTEEFKKRYPNDIVIRNLDGKIERRLNKKNDGYDYDTLISEYPEDEYTNNFNSEIEEENYKSSYLTNIDSVDKDINLDKNIDPQNYEFKKENSVYGVKGYYENGKVKITSEKIPDKKYEKYSNNFRKSLNEAYKSINDKYYGIKKLNFMYTVDFNSEGFSKYISGQYVNNVVMPSKAIGLGVSIVLLMAFAMISNYKKLKGVSFVESIKRFPIEVVIFLTILWFVPVSLIIDGGGNYLILNKAVEYISQFIMVFFALIASYYYVMGLKSIYNDGVDAFVFSNSIIIRAFVFFADLFRRTLEKSKNYLRSNVDFSRNSLNKLRTICIGLIILGTMASVIVVRTGLRFVVWIIWMVLVFGVYNILKSSMIDLENVTKKSKLIAEGDYNTKIEDSTYFKGIAHSFNTISDNLSSAVDEAVKSERLKTELITNVSHDLKTPLTSIINYSDLIVNDNTTEEEKDEYAKVIYEKSIKLKDLIEDLFEVSKASSGNIELNLESIDLRAVLMQIAGEWEDKLEDKNLQIVQTLPEEQVILNLDGNRTSRVLDNLFSNIYKYAMPGTRVYIDLEKNDREIILMIKNISNYSLNISASELVDRFKRGDESRNTEGSGLGLSIASSLIEAQGGKFNIEIDGDLFKTKIKF